MNWIKKTTEFGGQVLAWAVVVGSIGVVSAFWVIAFGSALFGN